MTMYVVRFELKWKNGFPWKSSYMNLFTNRKEAEENLEAMNKLNKTEGEYKLYTVEVDGLDK